jgi:ABC-type transporter Mla subunit MlaD
MSKQETVKYSIRQDGLVSVETSGMTGSQCLEVTKGVEEELGTVLTREFSPDYYENEPVEEFVHDSEGC